MITLTLIDFILIIILFFFAFGGFFFGLFKTLGMLLGTIVGIIVSANYFSILSGWIGNPFGISDNVINIISFLLIFIVVSRLIGFAVWMVAKILKILPFMKTIDRLAGLVLGLIEGSLILGVLLVFVVQFPFTDSLISSIEASNTAQWLFGIGNWLTPLLPDLFDQARGMINF